MDIFDGTVSIVTDAAPVSGLRIVSLPIDQLDSNDYNPNKLTAAKFAELVAEVRHLERLPKPIIERQQAPTGKWQKSVRVVDSPREQLSPEAFGTDDELEVDSSLDIEENDFRFRPAARFARGRR